MCARNMHSITPIFATVSFDIHFLTLSPSVLLICILVCHKGIALKHWQPFTTRNFHTDSKKGVHNMCTPPIHHTVARTSAVSIITVSCLSDLQGYFVNTERGRKLASLSSVFSVSASSIRCKDASWPDKMWANTQTEVTKQADVPTSDIVVLARANTDPHFSSDHR